MYIMEEEKTIMKHDEWEYTEDIKLWKPEMHTPFFKKKKKKNLNIVILNFQ